MKHPFILLMAVLLLSAPPSHSQQTEASLDLQAVLGRFMERNLDLQAARYRLERTKAEHIAARFRPNPGLTVAAENLPLSGPTPFGRLYEVSAVYSETIELGGKRELRGRAADLAVSVAEAQFADAMRRGLAEVKRRYYEAVLTRYNLDVANENRRIFEQVLQFHVVRFEEGAIPEIDLVKVRLERMKIDATLRQATLNYRQAGIRLLEKLGESVSTKVDIRGELESSVRNLQLDSLRQEALTERTDVLAARTEVEAANERLALERARGKPDIQPYAGYKRIGQDNTVLFGVNLPLKLRDRNQAGIARAEADVKTAETALQILRNRAVAEVEAAYEAFRSASDQIQTFENDLLRQSEEASSITLAAYEEGGTELLPFLHAQQTRFEVRQQYFKTLFDFQASLIDLEIAVGREIRP
jgi:cobalt-zinc-cadmium efflux system outer membrane protein